MLKEKYINPFTDFGFKKIFGSEFNKDILMDFLNELLKGQEYITDLQYRNNEHHSRSPEDRMAVFDLYCENQHGEKFIIEVQRGRQQYFKDRSLFYATFPIQEQASKDKNWNFKLKKVYLIAILDFKFEPQLADEPVRHTIKLVDQDTNKVFYDKLTFIYLEMPRFKKNLKELGTRFDKWLFLLQHLPDLQKRPKVLQERIFQKVFTIAEISKLNKQDMDAYEQSLKYYRDYKNSISTAREEGIELGHEKGLKEGEKRGEKKGLKAGVLKVALSMIKEGYSDDKVTKLTGLTLEEVNKLKE